MPKIDNMVKIQLRDKELLQQQLDIWRTIFPQIDEELKKTPESTIFIKAATLVAWIIASLRFENETERRAFLIVANELSRGVQ